MKEEKGVRRDTYQRDFTNQIVKDMEIRKLRYRILSAQQEIQRMQQAISDYTHAIEMIEQVPEERKEPKERILTEDQVDAQCSDTIPKKVKGRRTNAV